MRKLLLSSFIVIALWILCNCSPGEKFAIDRYVAEEKIDTLLADIVTIIGRKPSGADWQSKYDPAYRQYYIKHSSEFSFEYFYIDKNGIHYFYMIRPARHIDGNRRGVGGKYIVTSDGRIDGFEEVFNTPVKGVDELRKTGSILFRELVKTGNIERYSMNRNYVEWPDERLKYDKTRKEWRYDVD